MNRAAALALILAACTNEPDPPEDIAPPPTGLVHRFVVDEIDIVRRGAEAEAFAADLDGNSVLDAKLNQTIGLLFAVEATTPAGNDQVRAGVIASTVEITAANLETADAAIRYLGRDGAAAVPVAGRFVNGELHSNRSVSTSYPGSGTLVLPVILDADASELPAERLEMDLTPSARGGYDLVIRGGIPRSAVLAEAKARIFQMIAANPQDHRLFSAILDLDADGVPEPDAFELSPVLDDYFVADLDTTHLSFWVRVHLTPCAEGRCLEAQAPTCFDRVANADEVGVDCGGPCQLCGDDERCSSPDDCFSGACTAGACAVPTCTDGIRNGLEANVDCGAECAGCVVGAYCELDTDCASEECRYEINECL